MKKKEIGVILQYVAIAAVVVSIIYFSLLFIIPQKVGYIEDEYKLSIEDPYSEHVMEFNSEELRKYINENKFVRINGSQYKFIASETIRVRYEPESIHFDAIDIAFCLYNLDHSVISDGRKKYKLSEEDIEYFIELFNAEELIDE